MCVRPCTECTVTLGTPDERSWPGVSKLPDYKSSFPKWQAKSLGHLVTRLDHDGVDILTVIDLLTL